MVTQNLAPGVKLNWELLLKCGQGSVPIGSLINLEKEVSESDDELLISFMGSSSTSQQPTSPLSDATGHETTAPSNDKQMSDNATAIADCEAEIRDQIDHPEDHGESSTQALAVNVAVENQESNQNTTLTGDVMELTCVSLK